jgi:hypothetical protein
VIDGVFGKPAVGAGAGDTTLIKFHTAIVILTVRPNLELNRRLR